MPRTWKTMGSKIIAECGSLLFTTKVNNAHYDLDLDKELAPPTGMAAQPNTVSPLGRALVQQGRLVQADANAIQMEAAKAGVSFIQQLVQVKKLSAKEVSLFAAQ